jgi:hypothetical protein
MYIDPRMSNSENRKRKAILWLFCAGCGLAGSLIAQVPDAPLGPPPPVTAPPPASPAKTEPPPGAQTGTFLGKDIPRFDPKTELLTWDGKSWNINNNRLFQARFEKYLNAPEETDVNSVNYQKIIAEILVRLGPANASRENVDYAFRLLNRAATYEPDARLCETIADTVYSAWRSQKAMNRLAAANVALEEERKKHEWNARLAGEDRSIEKSTSKGGEITSTSKTIMSITPYATRLAETMAQIKANQLKSALTEVEVKVQFQALMSQLFLQRRYQHVLISTRFYRAVFSDGDTKLTIGKDAKDLFEKSTGSPPTVSTLDSLANEAIRDVREGVKAYEFLVSQHELESATKRLGEAFIAGEYMPEIRTLPREKKRQALEFSQKSNQLLSTMEAKDFTSAEKLLDDLTKIAKDFDGSQARAGIATSRSAARLHIMGARNAVLKGDDKTFKDEVAAAAGLWPLNPELAEFSEKAFNRGDVQQTAINDFDQLLNQKNYRRIAEDKFRFAAAVAVDPARQVRLDEVMRNVGTIEAAILRAEEMARQSNSAGAWESVEKAAHDFPDDTKLNQLRADLSSKAADFVWPIRKAQELEKKEQVGSSLAWFLKARKIYPASEFANEGIERLKKRVLPES